MVTRLFQDEGDGEYLGAYATALAKAERTVALLGRIAMRAFVFCAASVGGEGYELRC